MSPRVLVILLNWNGIEDTLECLQSVAGLEYDNFGVIVVDNGSTADPTPTIARLYPAVEVVRSPDNLGYAGGNNLGIREALRGGAEYVWLLNNDAVTPKATLRRLVDMAESEAVVGLVSPLIYQYGRDNDIQACGGVLDWDRFEFAMTRSPAEWQDKAESGSAYLWGTALLIKRAVLEEVGDLEERYFAYAEDRQYCVRALRAGYQLRLDSTARVFHKWARASGGDLYAPRKVFLLARNNYFFWMENLRGLRRLAFLRKFLVDSIRDWTDLAQRELPEACRERKRATWCAVRGQAGSPEACGLIPRWADAAFFSRPEFWGVLLSGQAYAVARRKLGRLARKAIGRRA